MFFYKISSSKRLCEALSKTASHLKCEWAKDGVHGLETLKTKDELPGLIILDINMPRMDGFSCLKEIKKDAHLKQIPVVLYSTADTPELRKLAQSLGAADFIKKHIRFVHHK